MGLMRIMSSLLPKMTTCVFKISITRLIFDREKKLASRGPRSSKCKKRHFTFIGYTSFVTDTSLNLIDLDDAMSIHNDFIMLL